MEEQFVTYDIAVALKELGFDDICFTKYGMTSKRFYNNYIHFKNSDDLYDINKFSNDLVAAPLYQQALKFLREFYNIKLCISWTKIDNWLYEINHDEYGCSGYNTYEEAMKYGLQECLKLIK